MEDDRVAILEAQLAQAKLIAEEADKKYEEVREHATAVVGVTGLLVDYSMHCCTYLVGCKVVCIAKNLSL